MNHNKLLQEMKEGKPTRGLDIDEINYMRAYTTARIEMEKGALLQSAHNFMTTGSVTGESSWVKRVLQSFSYFDYFLIAFKLLGRVRSLTRLRRK